MSDLGNNGERPKDNRSTGVEWVGGKISLPIYVNDEDPPYRPDCLIWLDQEGAILGSKMVKPGEMLRQVGESLKEAIEQPMRGRPRQPAQVRVAAPELATELRRCHPDIEVVCGPTPELDAVAEHMREMAAADEGSEPTYLTATIKPDAIASLFKAAASLYRASPWDVVPDDQCLISVTAEQLGVNGLVLSVIGQLGQDFGLVLFNNLDDYDRYLAVAEAIDAGQDYKLPPFLSLNFERGADLVPSLRKEISQHDWQVAGANAYPVLLAVDDDFGARPPTAQDVILLEALSRALSKVIHESDALKTIWASGETLHQTVAAATHHGSVDVTLQAPYPQPARTLDASTDVLSELARLARSRSTKSEKKRIELENALLEQFATAPEAADLEHVGDCSLLMDLAYNYFGRSIATLPGTELRQVVFELIPRKVLIEPAMAESFIQQFRAFYAYLKREHGLKRADACLRVLGGNAVKKLESALSDGNLFGMGKSLITAGAEAGFDVHSEEGLASWMESIEGKPVPPSVRLPNLDDPAARPVRKRSKSKKSRKDKRKAARKARKRNR